MKYYVISTKGQSILNNNGEIIGYKPSKFICIVEKEEIAKDFCRKNLDYKYEEKETR